MVADSSTKSLAFALILGCAILTVTVTVNYDVFSMNAHIANETRDKSNTLLNDKTKSCVDTVNLLSRHIHDQQEYHGLRQWALPLDTGLGFIEFPGLDDNLIRSSFEGRRIFFLGDSTTKNLHNWLYNLLKIHNEYPYDKYHLSTMNLSDANSFIVSELGCAFKRRSGSLSCDGEQRNITPPSDLDMRIIHNECSNNTFVYSAMRDHKPEIIVANIGLWLLHFQAKGRDQEGCVVKQWINYEHWLEHTLQVAQEVGARALFFKTTNTICSDKYTGAYSKANKLYAMMDNVTLIDCFNNIKFTQKINGLPTHQFLSDGNIHNYCANATFNNHGSAHLNQRLLNFVMSNRKTTSVELHIFDDNIIKSCAYTEIGDARHYHPLNLVRIRLLAHLISCIE